MLARAVCQHVMATADRLEAELGPEQFMYDGGCQRDIENSPEPGAPITVGLDGGYIFESQGILPRQPITFLSDGGDTRITTSPDKAARRFSDFTRQRQKPALMHLAKSIARPTRHSATRTTTADHGVPGVRWQIGRKWPPPTILRYGFRGAPPTVQGGS